MTDFNLNHHVAVKLTQVGRDMLDARRVQYREDAEGWSDWQLWHLMQEFGARISMGCSLPFETTIRIVGDGLPDVLSIHDSLKRFVVEWGVSSHLETQRLLDDLIVKFLPDWKPPAPAVHPRPMLVVMFNRSWWRHVRHGDVRIPPRSWRSVEVDGNTTYLMLDKRLVVISANQLHEGGPRTIPRWCKVELLQ